MTVFERGAEQRPRPIPFCSFIHYRPFCDLWWREIVNYAWVGWRRDIVRFCQRGRYGWAPMDVWGSFDLHLALVAGGGLRWLAEHTTGLPGTRCTFDADMNTVNDDEAFAKWRADLSRWADAFDAFTRDDYYEIHGDDYRAWNADEQARTAAMHRAWLEIEPELGALWD